MICIIRPHVQIDLYPAWFCWKWMKRWEAMILWSSVLEYLCQHSNEENFFEMFCFCNDLFWYYDDYSYVRNENIRLNWYIYIYIYIQLGFVGNGQGGKNLCSSEAVYLSIYVRTAMKKFALTIFNATMTCYAALTAVMKIWMKNKSSNQYITILIFLKWTRRWEAIIFWSCVLKYSCQYRNEEIFVYHFCYSNDLFYWSYVDSDDRN